VRVAVVAQRVRRHRIAPAVALVLAAATFVLHGHDANAAAWAGVQVVLVAVATIDAATRRIPNVVTLTTAACAVALRLLLARGTLPETFAAGAICFAVFLLLAVVSRGAFGMGDVKLAALLGLLLGKDAVDALLLGALCGAAAALIVARRAGSLKATLAYGPYLCLGAAVVILVATPPALA
jgi:leader peptidase (prepilin peptidase) / N-methyltransferase